MIPEILLSGYALGGFVLFYVGLLGAIGKTGKDALGYIVALTVMAVAWPLVVVAGAVYA